MIAAWAELGAALTATALAQLTYKLYFRARRVALLGLAVALFVGASLCAYLALRHLTIGTVYMSTALTQMMVIGLSRWVLREPLGPDHGVALALIVGGVVLYAQ